MSQITVPLLSQKVQRQSFWILQCQYNLKKEARELRRSMGPLKMKQSIWLKFDAAKQGTLAEFESVWEKMKAEKIVR